MLAADDPKLAARLAAFGQPGLGHVLRTRRARATLSLMVLVLVAAVAAVIYMMTAFRPSGAGNGSRPAQQTSQRAAPARPLVSPVRCDLATALCGTWAIFDPAASAANATAGR